MIETRDIRVDYGDVTAVTDLTLSIGPGQIYGLIGPNGAGKSSFIRVLATLRVPTYGEARIAGHDTVEHIAAARRQIGYMPDLAPVYKNLRCWEFLDLFARAYFVSRTERRARIAECIDLVSLQSKRTAMAGTLSRGMTQRLVLAKTLLHDPSVLLLDEPASGLDPIARIDLRNLLRRMGDEGKAVIISSHILNELSEFCTSIGIMEKGHLVLDGSIDAILAEMNTTRRFTVETVGAAGAAAAMLGARDDVTQVALDGARCAFESTFTDEDAAWVLAELVRSGVAVKAFYERKRGVEDVMMHVGASEVS
ncbi:MAG: ABC transporter ATP-binding protein [Phycisphaeraceae bacterium]|nr:MAG: ABC transporter ATP-binding protein [Phycisphaeraceae bacterium]